MDQSIYHLYFISSLNDIFFSGTAVNNPVNWNLDYHTTVENPFYGHCFLNTIANYLFDWKLFMRFNMLQAHFLDHSQSLSSHTSSNHLSGKHEFRFILGDHGIQIPDLPGHYIRLASNYWSVSQSNVKTEVNRCYIMKVTSS